MLIDVCGLCHIRSVQYPVRIAQ